MKILSQSILAATVASAVLLATGAIDVDVHLSDHSANAFDLFGQGDDEVPTVFWQEGSQQDAIVPALFCQVVKGRNPHHATADNHYTRTILHRFFSHWSALQLHRINSLV